MVKKFSFFDRGITNTTPQKDIDIALFLDMLKANSTLINKIRSEKNKDSRQELKKRLSYVTFGGTFVKRANDKLKEGSGLACFDVDEIEDIESTREKIVSNKYTYCCFVSPSGNGLKFLVKIPVVGSDEEYKSYWQSIAKFYDLSGNDIATKDVSRACYLSYDPKPYFNPDSLVYDKKDSESPQVVLLSKLPTETMPDDSRSGLEMSAICKLILKGKTEKEVFEEMQKNFTKWSAGTEAYRKRSYEMAIDFLLRKNTNLHKEHPLRKEVSSNFDVSEQKELENIWKDSLYYDEDLKDYKRPEEEYLIDDFILKGQVGILVGASGERKTFIALQTILAGASGKKALDLFNVPRKLKVLLIDEENGKPEIDKRIKALKKGMGISLDEKLDIAYLSFFNAKLDDPNKQKKIIQFVEEFQPDLIVVDCLQRVLGIDIDKENQLLSHFLTGFVRPLSQKYGLSWLFVHHYRKKDRNQKYTNPLDEIRGASELRNYIRFAWGIKRPGKQRDPEVDTIILKQLKLSNAPPSPDRVLSFITEKDSLIVKYEGEAEDVLSAEQLCAQAIKDWIIEEDIREEFQTKDVVEEKPGGYGKTTISAGLKVLWQQGFLSKKKQGVWIVDSKSQQTLGGSNETN